MDNSLNCLAVEERLDENPIQKDILVHRDNTLLEIARKIENFKKLMRKPARRNDLFSNSRPLGSALLSHR